MRTILLLCLSALTALATPVQFNLQHFTGSTQNRKLTVTPKESWITDGTNFIGGMPLILQPSLGVVTTNLVSADYYLTIEGFTKRWLMSVPNTNATLRAVDLCSGVTTYYYTNPIIVTVISDTNYFLTRTNGSAVNLTASGTFTGDGSGLTNISSTGTSTNFGTVVVSNAIRGSLDLGNGPAVVDFTGGMLKGATELGGDSTMKSVDWIQRGLYDSSGYKILDWKSIDSAGGQLLGPWSADAVTANTLNVKKITGAQNSEWGIIGITFSSGIATYPDAALEEKGVFVLSLDGKNFTGGNGYAPFQAVMGSVRDVSIMKLGPTYFLSHTTNEFDDLSAGYPLFASSNLMHWVHLGDYSAAVTGEPNPVSFCWGPTLSVIGPNVVVFHAAATNGTGADKWDKFKLRYRTCPTNNFPAGMSGVTQIAMPSENVIEIFPFYHNGTNYAFYKNDTTKYMCLGKWTDPNDLAGSFVNVFVGSGWGMWREGVWAIQTPYGAWRMYTTKYMSSQYTDLTNGLGMCFSECPSGLDIENPANWSALTNCWMAKYFQNFKPIKISDTATMMHSLAVTYATDGLRGMVNISPYTGSYSNGVKANGWGQGLDRAGINFGDIPLPKGGLYATTDDKVRLYVPKLGGSTPSTYSTPIFRNAADALILSSNLVEIPTQPLKVTNWVQLNNLVFTNNSLWFNRPPTNANSLSYNGLGWGDSGVSIYGEAGANGKGMALMANIARNQTYAWMKVDTNRPGYLIFMGYEPLDDGVTIYHSPVGAGTGSATNISNWQLLWKVSPTNTVVSSNLVLGAGVTGSGAGLTNIGTNSFSSTAHGWISGLTNGLGTGTGISTNVAAMWITNLTVVSNLYAETFEAATLTVSNLVATNIVGNGWDITNLNAANMEGVVTNGGVAKSSNGTNSLDLESRILIGPLGGPALNYASKAIYGEWALETGAAILDSDGDTLLSSTDINAAQLTGTAPSGVISGTSQTNVTLVASPSVQATNIFGLTAVGISGTSELKTGGLYIQGIQTIGAVGSLRHNNSAVTLVQGTVTHTWADTNGLRVSNTLTATNGLVNTAVSNAPFVQVLGDINTTVSNKIYIGDAYFRSAAAGRLYLSGAGSGNDDVCIMNGIFHLPSDAVFGWGANTTVGNVSDTQLRRIGVGSMSVTSNLTAVGTITATNGYIMPPVATGPATATNGVAAIWNSNSVVFLRSSAVGANTYTDTKLSP